MSKAGDLVRGNIRGLVRLLLLTAILVLAMASGRIYFGRTEYRFLTGRVNRIIDGRMELMRRNLDLLSASAGSDSLLLSLSGRDDFRKLAARGITLLAFRGDDLIFWSDPSVDIPDDLPSMTDTGPVIFLQNGWFTHSRKTVNDTVYVGLFRIYSIYDIQNRLVRSGFPDYFRLPQGTSISFDEESPEYAVSTDEGVILFSLSFPGVKENTLLILLPLILWLAFGIMLLATINDITNRLKVRNLPLIPLLVKASLYAIFYYLVVKDIYPGVFSRTELFSPAGFSLAKLIPSMGHLLIMSILIADLGRSFHNSEISSRRIGQNLSGDFLRFTMLLIPGTLMVIFFHRIMIMMMSHPNLSFEGYRIASVSFVSVAGLTSLFLLLMAPSFYILKLLKIFSGMKIWVMSIAVALNITLFADIALFGVQTGYAVVLVYLALIILLKVFSNGRMGLFNFSFLYAIIFSLYTTYFISKTSITNELDSLRVSAVTHAAGHDFVAEYLLIELSPALEADSMLTDMMKSRSFGREDADDISEYLRSTYFGSYWTNYDFSVVLCQENSSLLIDDGDDMAENCFAFFEETIGDQGVEISGTHFWFIENQTGRPSYMGKIYYDLPSGGTNGLFIELLSYVNPYREGYPELLTDERYMRPAIHKDYSLAKYINGNLVLNTGDFAYPKKDSDIICSDEDCIHIERNGYDHFAYRHANVTVIFSRRVIPFLSRVVSFGYILIYLLLLSYAAIIICRRKSPMSLYRLTFRQKLQTGFLAVILFSFLGIAAGATYLSIEQYRQRHNDTLREKAASLYIELQHKLENEAVLTNNWTDGKYQSLSDLLVKFSNVFFTDINLFDSRGTLIATSRPEVYIRDLTGRRMNLFALKSLGMLAESEYISSEQIGRLEYLSIYVPFFNYRNELLAYLNIPYFGMQSKISAEISNLIVAIVNFSLLMILVTMSLAVLISERITSPIRMLGERLASVKLGRKSEPLRYDASDEIGEMVGQYNKMVEELEESVRKLSVSEREFAWREMAKQIAHEIKNPLTPMKLNVQQLDKAFRDGKPGFEKKLDKFTRNQIEYIDNLSKIATAFSNFARMPKAEPVQVDIMEQIKTTLELFKNTDDISFRVTCTPPGAKIVVFVDREHLNSIFSNLVKNAIQAIPQTRSGLIRVSVSLEGDKVVICVTDNGTGIPAEMKDRLFTPYFTTKSSGSGLGLSIVKRLVEGMAGEIEFVSTYGEGTTFRITLPVLYSVEKAD
jgi:signal transduction histidine kinase